MDGDIFQRLHAPQEPVHADRHISSGRVNHTGGHHEGLLFQKCKYIGGAHAEGSQLVLVHFDVNILFLHAKELRLLHIVHGGEAPANLLGFHALFFIAIAFAGDGIDGAIHIVEAVIDVGAVDAVWQISPLIVDQISHFMPTGLDVFLLH